MKSRCGWLIPGPMAAALVIAAGAAVGFAGGAKLPESVSADHARLMEEGLAIFSRHVRPILIKRCLKCHGGEREIQSGLNLATREGLLAGGTNGKAIVPGRSGASRLYRLIAHTAEPAMPLDGPKLSNVEIAHVARWIDCGAPYDEPLLPQMRQAPSWTARTIDAKARAFWAFQPLKPAVVPKGEQDRPGKARPRTPVDAFVQQALEAKKIEPGPEVDRRKLIRRLSFDLLGLPPTPAEVDAFASDPSPCAVEDLVDRLLASPHYGERWARHWLDVSRFAESHGFEMDTDRPTAYHFRDFVIAALNGDMPYDTFVRWQVAGDELAPHDPRAMMATGFLAAGVHSTQITKNEVEKQRYDELDDMLATTGSALLGLSIGCARCHDHKFDPIPQADYYRMLSAFTTTVRTEVSLDLGPGGTKPPLQKVLAASEGLPPLRLNSQGADFFNETFFLRRGDPNQKQGVAPLGFLQVLIRSPEREKKWPVEPPPGSRSSFRRAALAGWITDSQFGAGPLLARVIVNRLWQHHLGHGLVATPNDFGARGELPSHPELLDWLAAELIRNQWRLKPIHRLIVTGAVYRQSSQFDKTRGNVDPGNRLFWRHEKRRLEGEIIRDAILACGNLLEERMDGPGTLDEGQRRRSIYFTVKRSKLVPMMQVFDAPEALGSLGDRPSTTIAPQALLLLNNPIVRRAARAFAMRLLPAWGRSPESAVRDGYRIALGREPEALELRESAAYLDQQAMAHQTARQSAHASADPSDPRERALEDFCQVLLWTNEFVYVD